MSVLMMFLQWTIANAPAIAGDVEKLIAEFKVQHPELDPAPPEDEEGSVDASIDKQIAAMRDAPIK